MLSPREAQRMRVGGNHSRHNASLLNQDAGKKVQVKSAKEEKQFSAELSVKQQEALAFMQRCSY